MIPSLSLLFTFFPVDVTFRIKVRRIYVYSVRFTGILIRFGCIRTDILMVV